MTLSGSGATEFILSTTLLALDPAFDTSQAILAPVAGNFSIHWLAEAHFGGNWIPVTDLFDAEATVMGDSTRIDYGTAFYSTAIPEPRDYTSGIAALLLVVVMARNCAAQQKPQASTTV